MTNPKNNTLITNYSLLITLFLGFTFLACLLGYFLVYQQKYMDRPIRADGEGYYAYLPAFLIYKDFEMNRVDLYQPDAGVFEYPPIYFNPAAQKHINKYPLGVSFLILPFFIAAHLISRLIGLPLTGYTLIYQHFAGIAGIFYLIAGLFFLSRLYKIYFSKKAVLLTLASLVFASNLFHYATFDSLMSHVYSFFLISLFLYQFNIWQKKPSKSNSIAIGILLGLVFLVRNLNIIFGFLLLPFINKKRYKHLLIIIMLLLIALLPQLLYWHYAGGKFLLFSYLGESFNFVKPRVLKVLFSPRKGLFFWSPIFLLGLLGIKGLQKKIDRLFLGFLFVLPTFVFLISSWHDWAYGASFGHRTFIDIYPILGFFLVAFYEKTIKKIGVRKLILLLCFFIILNLTNMIKYWQRILPYDQVSLKIYLDNLFVFIRYRG